MTYPRLAIRQREFIVMDVVDGHRVMVQRTFWAVLHVTPAGETRIYAGRDDGIYGWADCVDFAHAVVKDVQRRRA